MASVPAEFTGRSESLKSPRGSCSTAFVSDPCVRFEFNDANSGTPFKQWNKGVRLARGKYIWLAESDDYAASQFLVSLVPLLNGDPVIGFAYCRSWRVTPEGINGFADDNLPDPDRWTANFSVDRRGFFRRYFALITPVPNASAVVFGKSLFERDGCADESLHLCGDWKLCTSMALEGRVVYSCEPMNYFRYHANNARSCTAQAGTDAVEYLYVTGWVLDRVSLPNSELKAIHRARAQGWMRALLSFRTPPAWRQEIFALVRSLDPHPFRTVLSPAFATVQRKLLRYWRELRVLFSCGADAASDVTSQKESH